jgi:PncC family amidohydrolase
MSQAEVLIDVLRRAKVTVSVAESCTGGLVGAAITAVAGSSDVFRGGVIAYTNELKQRLLNVRADTLARYGAVSGQTVLEMAAGACDATGADCAVAISGIAGPGGGTADKPVGLVYIGVRTPAAQKAFEHHFDGEREQVRSQSVDASIAHLLEMMGTRSE